MQERHPVTSSSASEVSLLGPILEHELDHGIIAHSLSIATSTQTWAHANPRAISQNVCPRQS